MAAVLDGQLSALDLLDGPATLPPFAIHSGRHPGMKSPCGYCGKVVGSGDGNGGGCGRLPDDRWCVWRFCAECLLAYGRPDINIHPNLKVLP